MLSLRGWFGIQVDISSRELNFNLEFGSWVWARDINLGIAGM